MGNPGMLKSRGRRVGHNWRTGTELKDIPKNDKTGDFPSCNACHFCLILVTDEEQKVFHPSSLQFILKKTCKDLN